MRVSMAVIVVNTGDVASMCISLCLVWAVAGTMVLGAATGQGKLWSLKSAAVNILLTFCFVFVYVTCYSVVDVAVCADELKAGASFAVASCVSILLLRWQVGRWKWNLISTALALVPIWVCSMFALVTAASAFEERGRANVCRNNLEYIQRQLTTYLREHGGGMPTTLADVMESAGQQRVLICPSTGRTYSYMPEANTVAKDAVPHPDGRMFLLRDSGKIVETNVLGESRGCRGKEREAATFPTTGEGGQKEHSQDAP